MTARNFETNMGICYQLRTKVCSIVISHMWPTHILILIQEELFPTNTDWVAEAHPNGLHTEIRLIDSKSAGVLPRSVDSTSLSRIPELFVHVFSL